MWGGRCGASIAGDVGTGANQEALPGNADGPPDSGAWAATAGGSSAAPQPETAGQTGSGRAAGPPVVAGSDQLGWPDSIRSPARCAARAC